MEYVHYITLSAHQPTICLEYLNSDHFVSDLETSLRQRRKVPSAINNSKMMKLEHPCNHRLCLNYGKLLPSNQKFLENPALDDN
jgi:hypothetical protein